MTSQLNDLIVRQRHSELVDRAEQARLASEARSATSASSRRWNISQLFAPRRLRAPGLAAAARQANPGPPYECPRCDS
jgi:hypothetical protein